MYIFIDNWYHFKKDFKLRLIVYWSLQTTSFAYISLRMQRSRASSGLYNSQALHHSACIDNSYVYNVQCKKNRNLIFNYYTSIYCWTSNWFTVHTQSYICVSYKPTCLCNLVSFAKTSVTDEIVCCNFLHIMWCQLS